MSARSERALELWREGTDRLLSGDLEDAIALFTRSLETEPTAEAYTFRGWAYSFAGRLRRGDRRVPEGHRDRPGLRQSVQRHRLLPRGAGPARTTAIGWFEKAKKAPRYEPRHFPYLNLGRLRAARGEVAEALLEFEGALAESPGDPIALRFLEELRYRVN